jgi:hypothetical protein
MIVKVLTPLSYNNQYFETGAVVDMDDATAQTLLKDTQPAIAEADSTASAQAVSPEPGEAKGAFNKGSDKVDPVADVENPELAPNADKLAADAAAESQTAEQENEHAKASGKFS